MKDLTIAVVGATGAVGQEILKVMAERQIPYKELRLLASARSAGTQIEYQGKTYTVRLRMQSSADASLTFYVDRKKQTPAATLPSTQGQWTTVELPLTLKAGQHTVMVFNGSTTSYLISELTLVAPESEGINETVLRQAADSKSYDLNGRLVPRSSDSVPSARDIRIVEGIKVLR